MSLVCSYCVRPRTFSCKRDRYGVYIKRRLLWNGLAVTGSFVLRRQLDPGPESMWFGAFIGCLSTASMQFLEGPVLTRINAIFTFKTNHDSKLQRGSKECMNDKLLNQTDFLQIRKYLCYISVTIVWLILCDGLFNC